MDYNDDPSLTQLLQLHSELTDTIILKEADNTQEPQIKWEEPKQIPASLLSVAPFDPSLLPESVRDWVEDISHRMQCPPDFVAAGAMVVMSSVIGRKCCIKPKRFDDWTVIPNLWGVIVGRPGVMKSPALSEVMKPLEDLEATANKEYDSQLEAYQIQKDIGEMSASVNKANATKAVKAGNIDAAMALLSKSADNFALEAPVLRRYKVVDSTYEALGNVLMDNPWGVLAYRDELTGLLRSLDKEGQEGARAFYLQGYDGNQSYTFDRIIRGGNQRIPAVCISVLGGIQPAKLKRYIHDAVKGGAGDDGLLQRFGFVIWPDISTEWKNVDKRPDMEARDRAFRVFERLDKLEPEVCEDYQRQIPKTYKFTPGAQDMFDVWRKEFEGKLRLGEYQPAMESHLSKYRKLVPAIALVCALADGEKAVSEVSLARALDWSEYLQSHANRAYAAGISLSSEVATALLKKIQNREISNGFKRADIYLKGWSMLSDPEEVNAATELLCVLGYLHKDETRHPKGGRPRETYYINPLIFNGEVNG